MSRLPQGWGCQDTLPGPDGSAGYESERSETVSPNIPSVYPCFLSMEAVRRCAQWVALKLEGLLFIEPTLAWTGMEPSLNCAPPSEPHLSAFSFTPLLSLNPTHTLTYFYLCEGLSLTWLVSSPNSDHNLKALTFKQPFDVMVSQTKFFTILPSLCNTYKNRHTPFHWSEIIWTLIWLFY